MGFSPKSLNLILHQYYQSLPSSLLEQSAINYLSIVNISSHQSMTHTLSTPARLSNLNKLSFASLWMGSLLGVGQRIENGLKDWFFPSSGFK